MLEMARQKGALGASLEARVLLHVAQPGIAQQLQALQGVRQPLSQHAQLLLFHLCWCTHPVTSIQTWFGI